MKKHFLLPLISLTFSVAVYAQAPKKGVGINTDDPKATLDAVANVTGTPALTPEAAAMPDGVLVPRMTEHELEAKDAAYGLPQYGALVFIKEVDDDTVDTPTVESSPKTVFVTEPGFYYYSEVAPEPGVWMPVDNGLDWHLTGNLLSDPATPTTAVSLGSKYLGTIDNNDLVFKRNDLQAGWLNSSDENTAFGVGALPTGTNGAENTAVGFNALAGNEDGEGNVAVGDHALESNTGGIYNTAVGSWALKSNDVGNDNTAVGNGALSPNEGDNNTAMGSFALGVQTDGDNNTAIGYYSIYLRGSGTDNTAVGYETLRRATANSNENSVLGSGALSFGVDVANNVAMGYKAGGVLEYGNNNILIGSNAGNNLVGSTNGSNDSDFNILIGSDTAAPIATGSKQLNIGDVIYGTGMYTATTATTNPAKIGIGTDDPVTTFEVNGAATNTESTVPTNIVGANATIDFSKSNLAHCSNGAITTLTLIGMKDGGTYTLAIDTTVGLGGNIPVPALSLGANANGTIVGPIKYPVGGTLPTTKIAENQVVFSIVCIGTNAYVYYTIFGP
ncbi:MAG: hypothetical protein LBE36_07525 [Flavobacteriaceae bacterium]|jgi:hypothetical protein|nr:hypothetical protein [Flavobacteriaceae bacterium]